MAENISDKATGKAPAADDNAEQQRKDDDEKKRKQQKQEEETLSIRNRGPLSPVRPGANNLSAEDKNTNLYKLIAKDRGEKNIDGEMYLQLLSCVYPNSAKETEDGFKVDLLNGKSIQWRSVQKDGQTFGVIEAGVGKFGMQQANAMIALGRVHGWGAISVEGPEKNKEMLWLSMQRQAMHERDLQLSGAMPEGPLPYVANFYPAKTSETYKTYEREKAAWEKAHGGKEFDNSAAAEARFVTAAANKEAKASPAAPSGEKSGSRFVGAKKADPAAGRSGTSPAKSGEAKPRQNPKARQQSGPKS